jgi:hypothetical protein
LIRAVLWAIRTRSVRRTGGFVQVPFEEVCLGRALAGLIAINGVAFIFR